MLPKFTHSILLLTSLIDCLRASPTSHSISNPSQSKSSSYSSAPLEKRGRKASSRSSSASSVDSDSTIPPDAPVLSKKKERHLPMFVIARSSSSSSLDSASSLFTQPEAPVQKPDTLEDGGSQGQKRKRVRSDEQKRPQAQPTPAVQTATVTTVTRTTPAANRNSAKKPSWKELKAANTVLHGVNSVRKRQAGYNRMRTLKKQIQMEMDPTKLATFKKDLEEKIKDQAVQALEWKAVKKTAKEDKAINNKRLSKKTGKSGKELWKVAKAKIDKNPDFATERKLRNAVSYLRMKVTDPKTLAELEKKEKKLLEVRQRLKAEKEVNRETLDAADPDKTAVKKRKSSRENFAKRKKEKALAEKNAVANIMMRVRDINYISLIGEYAKEEGDNDNEMIEDTDEGGVETIEEEMKNEGSEEEEIEEE
jgi:hypothetical protein